MNTAAARGTAPPRRFSKDFPLKFALGVGFLEEFPRLPWGTAALGFLEAPPALVPWAFPSSFPLQLSPSAVPFSFPLQLSPSTILFNFPLQLSPLAFPSSFPRQLSPSAVPFSFPLIGPRNYKKQLLCFNEHSLHDINQSLHAINQSLHAINKNDKITTYIWHHQLTSCKTTIIMCSFNVSSALIFCKSSIPWIVFYGFHLKINFHFQLTQCPFSINASVSFNSKNQFYG